MRGGRLGSRVDEGRSKARKVLRIARFCESMTIRMHRRPLVSLGRQRTRRRHRPRDCALPDGAEVVVDGAAAYGAVCPCVSSVKRG